MRITFVAKLRWVPKRYNEQMTIRNFEAIRLMATAIDHAKNKEWDQYGAAKKEALMLLDEEQKEYTSGQKLTIPMATAAECSGFSDLGGVH